MRKSDTGRAATQPRRGLNHDEAALYIGVSHKTFDAMVHRQLDLDLRYAVRGGRVRRGWLARQRPYRGR
jgi:hypothetical protein